jgi:allophanate hydrolase subunit 2
MHEGVPPGGSLVPELAARANAAVGNAEDTPLVEVFGGITLTPRGGSLTLATEEGIPSTVTSDQPFDVPAAEALRVRYVAVSGGFLVPEALGGRGTLLVARLGGHEGRALRRGDRILVGGRAPSEGFLGQAPLAWAAPDLQAPVRVVPGPDASCFAEEALGTLFSSPFSVLATSDRTGLRLMGPRLARLTADVGRSAPMVKGAIQVPSSGEPIVLGPDHPTTGGYPVLAVVVRADLGRLFAKVVGATASFALVSQGEARDLASCLEKRG